VKFQTNEYNIYKQRE